MAPFTPELTDAEAQVGRHVFEDGQPSPMTSSTGGRNVDGARLVDNAELQMIEGLTKEANEMTITESAVPDLAQVGQRLQHTWASGDFQAVAMRIPPFAVRGAHPATGRD